MPGAVTLHQNEKPNNTVAIALLAIYCCWITIIICAICLVIRSCYHYYLKHKNFVSVANRFVYPHASRVHLATNVFFLHCIAQGSDEHFSMYAEELRFCLEDS